MRHSPELELITDQSWTTVRKQTEKIQEPHEDGSHEYFVIDLHTGLVRSYTSYRRMRGKGEPRSLHQAFIRYWLSNQSTLKKTALYYFWGFHFTVINNVNNVKCAFLIVQLASRLTPCEEQRWERERTSQTEREIYFTHKPRSDELQKHLRLNSCSFTRIFSISWAELHRNFLNFIWMYL